uniref:Uncharacterized protein n=1 Tax=Curvibacter symbiont subsp. Hydra magnipapillata TaxID=667019 RepID=C9YGA0_CURXX|nr:hypothetical protein Csp_B18000 [Curvibacter putative symbiont of Hydra magnipapillata]
MRLFAPPAELPPPPPPHAESNAAQAKVAAPKANFIMISL